MERVKLNTQESLFADQIVSYDIHSAEFKECDHVVTMQACKYLTESLLDGGAISQHRIEYFINPEYFLGRGNKARKDYFEERLGSGSNVLEHQDFLKYLDYFINGSKLSEGFKRNLERLKKDCSYDSDFPKESQNLIRSQFKNNIEGLSKADFADEVFNICLDLGLSLYISSRVQANTMMIRQR